MYTTAALYRDGQDSVAMSLGAPRRFVLRPVEGDAAPVTLALGRGDLLVMGGTCQRTWRHGIPKVASAGPRIALMLRPAWARSYRTSISRR